MVSDGLWCSFEEWNMGTAGEVVAAEYHVARGEQDEYQPRAIVRRRKRWRRDASPPNLWRWRYRRQEGSAIPGHWSSIGMSRFDLTRRQSARRVEAGI